jgi:hypothetical protein
MTPFTVKEYLKYLNRNFLFYLAIAIILVIFSWLTDDIYALQNIDLLHFDAILYFDIRNHGYHSQWLCAFFPGFPFFWKFINVNAIGIATVNAIVFILSVSALAAAFKPNLKRQLLSISIPSLIFMFVPYSESLFYMACTFLILGLRFDNLFLLLAGLLLSSLIRPTTFVFVPALLLAFYFTHERVKVAIYKSLVPISVLLLGLFTTILIHYWYTKKWFVFFEAQKLWKNYFHVPSLPFTSWGGDAIVRFDASCLALAIICMVFFVRSLSYKAKTHVRFPADLVFSVSYVIGTVVLVLFYRDGNLYSINRFIYATPFIIVCMYHFFEKYEFRWKDVIIVFMASEALWLLFNSYNHIHNFLMFTTVSVYFVLMLFTKFPKPGVQTIAYAILILSNCYGLIKLYLRYLNHGWIG